MRDERAMPESAPFVVRPDRLRAAALRTLVYLTILLVVPLGYLAWRYSNGEPASALYPLALVIVVMNAVLWVVTGYVVFIPALGSRRPLLAADQQGVWITTLERGFLRTVRSTRYLPWNDVEAVSARITGMDSTDVESIGREVSLCIRPRDVEAALERQPEVAGLLSGQMFSMGAPYVVGLKDAGMNEYDALKLDVLLPSHLKVSVESGHASVSE